jgi:hypothetical protein
VTFNIVWKFVRGDGNIARFDGIEQLAAGSMAARRGSRTARSTSDCAQGEEAI